MDLPFEDVEGLVERQPQIGPLARCDDLTPPGLTRDPHLLAAMAVVARLVTGDPNVDQIVVALGKQCDSRLDLRALCVIQIA